MTTPSVPAGWQPDPEGGEYQRWWNGTAWTEWIYRKGATVPSAIGSKFEPYRKETPGEKRYQAGGSWEIWTGKQWSVPPYSINPAALRDPRPLDSHPPVPVEKRVRMMNQAVEDETLRGAAILNRTDASVIMSFRRPVRHFLHALMTVLTLGLWSTVWIIMAIARKDDRVRLEIDPYGHVWPTQAA